MEKLLGKSALISGGARGIGGAAARLLVQAGAKVVIGDVLEDVGRKHAADLGPAASFVHLDVTSEASWQKAVAHAIAHGGGLNVLVNNAGIFRRGGIADTTPEQYMQMVNVNQLGVFLGMRAALPALRGKGGAIVNISSTSGMVGSSNSCAYSATKFAVRGMTKSAALEFGPLGIRVNSVHPGNVDTDMSRAGLTPEIVQSMAMRIPLRRQGQPGEVAELILWLASDASSFCTGSEFVVDGGLIAG